MKPPISNSKSRTVAIIVAAGSSRRFGRDKLWLKLGTKPVVAHTLAAFQKCATVNAIILIVPPDKPRRFQKLKPQYPKLTAIIHGGSERQFSVFNGIYSLPPHTAIAVIHDAARPCVTPQLISQTIAAARQYGAAIAACPLADTVKEIHPQKAQSTKQKSSNLPKVRRTLDRSRLWAAQTPQAFRADLIRCAYKHVIEKNLHVTDDAAAVELMGKPVHLVLSNSTNLKITRPADIFLAKSFLTKR